MKHFPLVLVSALMLLLAVEAHAQIIVDPRPFPGPRPMPAPEVELRSIDLDGQIRNQIAEVTVTQTLYNPGRRPAEAQLVFPVPADAALQDLVLVADGQELAGEVLPLEEARRRYREIVSQMIDPALMEYVGYGLVQTSVFPVPAGGESRVVFRYTQVLPRDGDRVSFIYPFGTARRTEVERLRVALTITGEMGPVYSPTHDFAIDRQNGRTVVRYEDENVRLERDVRLLYSPAGDAPANATLLSHWPTGSRDGYFLLLAAPSIQQAERSPMPKTVIFVVDRSGSMAGVKMEQARKATEFVLNNLRDGDLFNIVAYDGRVDAFRPELQRFDGSTRREALAYVDGIRAGGMTNIDEALAMALGMVPVGDERPAYVVFLTDGMPTTGERREAVIAANAERANRGNARIFAFGVGYDLNARLLERLARMSGGTTEYVRPEDDLESAVAAFYSRMSAPVLSDVALEIDGTTTNRTYPSAIPDLFAGSDLIIAGRYTRAGAVTVRLTGRSADRMETMTFRGELAAEGSTSTAGFIEPLWATRRVADLLDQIDLEGRNDELVDEVVDLATQYGILTPFTAFLAEEDAVFATRDEQVGRAARALEGMDQVVGLEAVTVRAERTRMAGTRQAPSVDYGFIAAESGAHGRAETLRTVAGRAFYRRDDTWVEAGLRESDPAHAETVIQFSDDYFALADRLAPDLLPFLTFDEDVLVELDGSVYRIVAVQPE